MKSAHFLSNTFTTLIILFVFILANHKVIAQERCAIPVTDLVIEKQQPDGSTITLKQTGNPFLHYYETIDGFTVVEDAKDDYFKYAIHSSDGDLRPDTFIVRNPSKRTAKEKGILAKKSKHIRYKGKELQQRTQEARDFKNPIGNVMKSTGGDAGKIGMSAPVTSGTFKHLVLLIDYPDYPFKHDNPAFSELMNTIGYSENGQAGSFKDYYLDTSYGNLNVETTVAGWYTAKHNMEYYGYNPDKPFPYNAPELVREAVDAAEAAGIDFSQFDNDGNGSCDLVTIAHAGSGAETIGVETKYIWSHKSNLDDIKVVYDGVLINNYTMNPELNGGEASTVLSDIGIYVHEFGHALGLPDLYDFTTSNGAGKWCAMSWSSNQRTPIEFNPWFKEKLGWMSPTVLNGSGTITNMDNTFDTDTYYRINTSDPQEFFMLANMQQTKWHTRIPRGGLMIWHIDTGVGNNTNVSRLHVVPEQADGLEHLQEPFPEGNQWDRGDPFPGITNNTSFTATSSPSTHTNDGVAVAMGITNITEVAGLISFDYSDGSTKQNQTISFDAIPNKVFGDADFGLVATTTSGLNSTFLVKEGPITITNGIVRISGAGTATVAANQAGDETYNPATEVVHTFQIAKAEQIIDITGIEDKMATDPSFEIVATVNSVLTLSYQVEGPVSLTGNTVTLTGVPGTVTVTVEQIGDVNHNPISQSTTFNVISEMANQTITFEALENKVFGASAFELFATTTSGLEVAFAVREGPIQLNGTTISIMGTGMAIIAANQAGNNTYNPADEVLRTIVIEKAEQHITITSIDAKLTTDEPFELVASVDSGMPLEYQINGPATLLGTTISLEGLAGTVSGMIYQTGDENYSATEQSFSFVVGQSNEFFLVKAYPNPTTDYLNIESQKPFFLRIYNIQGKKLSSFLNIQNERIDFRNYAKGIYILQGMDLDGHSSYKKIIKN